MRRPRLAVLALAAALLLTGAAASASSKLPGLMTGTAPWGPNDGKALKARLKAIGLDRNEKFITELHTHEPDGIIHVESPVNRKFTLGEFFDVWGLRFTKDCL